MKRERVNVQERSLWDGTWAAYKALVRPRTEGLVVSVEKEKGDRSGHWRDGRVGGPVLVPCPHFLNPIIKFKCTWFSVSFPGPGLKKPPGTEVKGFYFLGA